MRTPMPNEDPIGWIIEPKEIHPLATPYMTLKPTVAMKRNKAGDTVTPFYSQKPIEVA